MVINDYFENTEPTIDDVQHAYDKAMAGALFIVERLARKALKENPQYTEFFMAMGAWGFIKGDPNDGYWTEVSEELMDFIAEWDGYLKLTGAPMRFTATGPVVRDW